MLLHLVLGIDRSEETGSQDDGDEGEHLSMAFVLGRPLSLRRFSSADQFCTIPSNISDLLLTVLDYLLANSVDTDPDFPHKTQADIGENPP